MWKVGYNVGSVGDTGTLYHGQTVAQAKNVPPKPMSDVNATENFLHSYTDALVITAALQYFGMDTVESEPTKNLYTPDQDPKAYIEQKLGDLLDVYAIPTEEELTQQSDMLCPKCSKPYKTLPPLRKHLVDEHPPDEDGGGQRRPSGEDGVFNYSCSTLGMCLLAADFTDARKHADGERLFIIAKYLMLYFKVMGKTKYSYHVLRLLFQIHSLLTPRASHDLIWNRFVNTQTSSHTNFEPDRFNEHSNRGYKTNFRGLHGKVTEKAINRISRSSAKVNAAMEKHDKEGKVKPKSRQRTNMDHKKEVTALVEHMTEAKIFDFQAGRFHKCFPGVKRSVLATIDHDQLHKWIRTTYKTVSRESVFKDFLHL